jgi:hypothetical protein
MTRAVFDGVGSATTGTEAAFVDEHPWPLARRLVTDRVAFWRGVEIQRD